MAFRPILPRGIGTRRRSFEEFINDVAEHYSKQVEIVYVKEIEIILKEIIEYTPIDTGAAAGVLHNAVGSVRHELRKSHAAYGLTIGNDPGDSGWQLDIKQDSSGLQMAIVNPMWNDYLKFLEFGVVEPIAPATSHWVLKAWMSHMDRRQQITNEIANA